MLQRQHVSVDMERVVLNAQFLEKIVNIKEVMNDFLCNLEPELTIRPVFEKSLTDSDPKYFKKSSFSSLVNSAGRCRISSVLLPFVCTTLSFFSIFTDERSHSYKA